MVGANGGLLATTLRDNGCTYRQSSSSFYLFIIIFFIFSSSLYLFVIFLSFNIFIFLSSLYLLVTIDISFFFILYLISTSPLVLHDDYKNSFWLRYHYQMLYFFTWFTCSNWDKCSLKQNLISHLDWPPKPQWWLTNAQINICK